MYGGYWGVRLVMLGFVTFSCGGDLGGWFCCGVWCMVGSCTMVMWRCCGVLLIECG